MRSPPQTALAAALLCLCCPAWTTAGDDQDKLKVGVQPDGRIVVPTNQILKPAGTQVLFPGRPVALLLLDDGNTLAVQNKTGLVFLDITTGKLRQTLPSKVGLSVTGLTALGGRVYTSDARDHVRVAERQADGTFHWAQTVELQKPKVGGSAHPAGMALRTPEELWVASTRGNCIQR